MDPPCYLMLKVAGTSACACMSAVLMGDVALSGVTSSIGILFMPACQTPIPAQAHSVIVFKVRHPQSQCISGGCYSRRLNVLEKTGKHRGQHNIYGVGSVGRSTSKVDESCRLACFGSCFRTVKMTTVSNAIALRL